MSEITVREPITVSARSSNTIAAEIVAITNQARQMAVMAAIEVGRRLVEAKILVDHGEWGSYIEQECQMSHRSANNCMKLFHEWEQNPNSQALANMSYTNAVRLLSLPEEDREELLAEHDVSNMPSRDLDKLIRESKEAKEKAETDAARIRDLEQQLLDAQQQAASAKSDEGAWQEQIGKLTAARDKAVEDCKKAKQKIKDMKANPDIPAETLERLANEAAELAAKDAAATYDTKLEAAYKERDAAKSAIAAAEQTAQKAQQELANARNAARVSTPEAAAFSVLYPQVKETFNKLNGCRLKVAANDPELGEKLKEKMQQLVDGLQKAVE